MIDDDDYAIDVYGKITKATVELCMDLCNNDKNNTIKLYKQDENKATYICKRIPEDGKIDWKKSSVEVFNLIRALAYPYPVAYCYYKKEVYHIRRAELGEDNNKRYVGCIPGRVARFNNKGIEVLCGSGSIIIKKWEDKSKGIIEDPSRRVKSLSATLM